MLCLLDDQWERIREHAPEEHIRTIAQGAILSRPGLFGERRCLICGEYGATNFLRPVQLATITMWVEQF